MKKRIQRFDEYQEQADTTAVYDRSDPMQELLYLTLGLTGESGEVAEKMKKILRDHDGTISPKQKEEITQELGDVLWYLTQLAKALGNSLEETAKPKHQKTPRPQNKRHPPRLRRQQIITTPQHATPKDNNTSLVSQQHRQQASRQVLR